MWDAALPPGHGGMVKEIEKPRAKSTVVVGDEDLEHQRMEMLEQMIWTEMRRRKIMVGTLTHAALR